MLTTSPWRAMGCPDEFVRTSSPPSDPTWTPSGHSTGIVVPPSPRTPSPPAPSATRTPSSNAVAQRRAAAATERETDRQDERDKPCHEARTVRAHRAPDNRPMIAGACRSRMLPVVDVVRFGLGVRAPSPETGLDTGAPRRTSGGLAHGDLADRARPRGPRRRPRARPGRSVAGSASRRPAALAGRGSGPPARRRACRARRSNACAPHRERLAGCDRGLVQRSWRTRLDRRPGLSRGEPVAPRDRSQVGGARPAGMLHGIDRKGRLAAGIARERGWQAATVTRLLVLPDDRTARRRVERHAATYQTALPARTTDILRWIRRPEGTRHGVLFLSDAHLTSARHRVPGRRPTSRRS